MQDRSALTALVAALFVSCWLCEPRAAHAQAEDPLGSLSDAEAEHILELLDEADGARSRNRCDEAMPIYDEITSMVWLAAVRFWAGECLVELRRYDEAAAAFVDVAERGDAETAGAAEAALQALFDEHAATLELRVSGAPADVFVDGMQRGDDVEGELALSLAPGTYAVELTAAGHEPIALNVTLTWDEVAVRTVAFERVAAPPAVPVVVDDVDPVDRDGGGNGARIATASVLGAGGLGLIGWGVASSLDANEWADIWEQERAAGESVDSLNVTRDLRDEARRNAYIGYGAGGALVVGAVLTYLLWPERAGDDVAVVPWLGGTAGGAVRVRW